MQKRSLQLTALLMLACASISKSAELELSDAQNIIKTAQAIDLANATDLEITSLKEKVCAALAVLKCTLYKLEAILTEIDGETCCDNDNNDDDDDDCPSLDFDDCDDCNHICCDNDDDHSQNDHCKPAKLPINLNFDCHDNQNVKIYLKLQTCKKLKN